MGSVGRVRPLAVVLHYRRTASYGLNVLLGALEQELGPDPGVALHPASGADAALAAVTAALAGGHRVLVAWSFYSPEVTTVAAELARFRAEAPSEDVLNVAGGVHATAEPAATLASGFDAVVVGEGEAPFVELVRSLRDGADASEALGTTAGVVRPGPDGAVVRGEPAPRHPLGRYPAFARRHGRFNPIEITRGCVYGCTFCQTPFAFKARFRHRPPGDVADHVGALVASGRRDVRFVTPTALSYGSDDESVRLDAVEELLRATRAAAGSDGRVFFGTFPSEVRPEHVTDEALRLIRRYCDNDNLVIGGQSGSERVLAATNRGHGVADVERAAQRCVAAGLQPNVDLLFNLPGETAEDAAATLALARRLVALGARVHSHAFMPLPGTPLRDAPTEPLPAELRTELDRLASQGGAYGSWRRQEQVAAQLVAIRPPRRRP